MTTKKGNLDREWLGNGGIREIYEKNRKLRKLKQFKEGIGN